MKKWVLLLIGLLMFTGCANGDKKKNSSEGLEFKLSSTEDSYEVVGIYEFSYSGLNLVIPSTYNNLPVVSIGNYAFSSSTSLTSVQIPKSIKYIGNQAFYNCINLSKIKFEKKSNLIDIGEYAFSGCSSLKSFKTPKSVTKIMYNAFDGCINLETIDFEKGSSLTSIRSSAFSGCSSLRSITLPKSVTIIDSHAFAECLSLKTVKFESGSNLDLIEMGAFKKCNSLESIILPNNLKYIGSEAFAECSFLTSIEIPSSVETIYGGAFKGCTNLQKVNFEYNSKLKEIKEKAFSDCSLLTSINVPNGVTSIGHYVFKGCSSLTSIELPNSLKRIGGKAFSDCSSLTTINIPNSVTSIEFDAFENCNSLKYNEYGNCLYLGNEENPYLVLVNAKNTSIKEVIISENTKIIMGNAFSGCKSLEIIFVPKNVETIHDFAFYECSQSTIYFEIDNKPENWVNIFGEPFVKCFWGVNRNNLITQNGLQFIIKDGNAIVTGNNLGIKEVNIPSTLKNKDGEYTVTSIDPKVFYDCDSITSLIIPSSITSIDDQTFYDCDSLKSVSFGENSNLTSIGNYAFSSCDLLDSISIPKNVLTIGENAFDGCIKLKTVTFDKEGKLEIISKSAFSNCSMLKSIDLPNGVTTICGNAFFECNLLSSMTIPSNIHEIDYSAFIGCDSLKYNEYDNCLYLGNEENPYLILVKPKNKKATRITISDQTKMILDNAFNSCNIQSITIPDNVTKIGDYVFSGCNSLTSVVIPNSVESIGIGLFDFCISIRSITIPFLGSTKGEKENDVLGYLFGLTEDKYFYTKIPSSLKEVIITNDTRIGDYAFYNCNSLTSIVIPDNIDFVGDNAFFGCNSLIYNEYGNGLYLGSKDNPNLILVKAKDTSISDISLADSTKIIWSNAFSGCTLLTSITISDNVRYIGEFAFDKCSSLLSITIPKSVTYVGKYAFNNCSSIIIYCEEENALESWSDSWVINAGPVYWGVKQKIIQDGIIYIISGDQIIATGCTEELSTKVKINSQIKVDEKIYEVSIGKALFRGNTSIESITLPFIGSSLDQPTHFGYLFGAYSFDMNSKCVPSSLKKVTITGGSTILDYAFYGCSSLKNIVISNSVTHIGGNAFKNCSNLTIYCEVSSIPSGWNSNWNPSNCPVYWSNEWKYVNGVPTLN